ncbi:MAG: hypothetical protein LQ338_007425 [Usnochroma carphineum]|nr:MAG: hypothetical protein LQ338_007425 [Usnochroma carphineum]
MAPRAKAPPSRRKGRLLETGPRRATPIVKKPRQASSTRKGLRSQTKPPVSQDDDSRPVQSSSTSLAPISQPARIKRKRSPDPEAEADTPKDERPAKQPRRSARHRLEPSAKKLAEDAEADAEAHEPAGPSEQPQGPPLLSEKDSQSLGTIYKEVMASAASNSLKRTASHRSRVPSETGTDRTQLSTNSNPVYRRKNLAAVKIRLHAEPPDDVDTTIKDICNAKVLKQRRAELHVVAQVFRDGCLKNVRAQSGEDDFLDPLHTAIKALGLDKLCIHEKAAWRGELKPVVRQQPNFSSSFMAGIQQLEVDNASTDDTSVHGAPDPLRKRQQKSAKQKSATENYISPEPSIANAPTPLANDSQASGMMPPPAPVLEKVEDPSPVKTPHPDLSMGIELEALASALSSQDLDEDKAAEFIEWLQNEMVQHEPDGPLEPMLLLVPAPRALDLAFPFAVVEGKAYSTGKQIFEAENQAAVSIACAHKILHCLDRMANGGKNTETQSRVLFSITTQGPIHELWAHWTVVKAGARVFESKLWDSWNGLVPERAEDFMVKLNSLCLWGTGPFLETVVELLRKVARKASKARV